MLDSGKYTCGDHPVTHTTSHKDPAVGTKNLQFGLQAKGQISTGLMAIARVSSRLLIGVLLMVSFQQIDHEGIIHTVL